jgi:glucosylceramidase
MRRILLPILCALGIFVMHETSAAQVQAWITSSDEAGVITGQEQQPKLAFGPNAKDSVTTIEVNGNKIYQRMEGGGAAFTDAAAWLITEKLSAAQREKVMQRMFDPVVGIGLSFLRNPIGSSDLTREWYTDDDNPADRSDASLPHFSIEHDLAHVVPLTKLARQLNPSFRLMINA